MKYSSILNISFRVKRISQSRSPERYRKRA
jgi:hypothetical protein